MQEQFPDVDGPVAALQSLPHDAAATTEHSHRIRLDAVATRLHSVGTDTCGRVALLSTSLEMSSANGAKFLQSRLSNQRVARPQGPLRS
jgi:hypothetical protein